MTFTAMLLAACGGGSIRSDPEYTNCDRGFESFGAFATVPTGQFRKGERPIYPEEQPTLTMHVYGFEIQIHEVTNRQFTEFVHATGYVTDAERSAAEGGPGAGSAVFKHPGSGASVGNPWALVAGATWRAPAGPGSTIAGLDNYPVVHVSQADARAYAEWTGARLPSEVEWEYAASLGLADPSDPISGAYGEYGQPVANTWQGVFPIADTQDDGYGGLAPVGCFAPSAIGLYDMIGNVWEWTDTPYAPGQHTIKGGSYLSRTISAGDTGQRRASPRTAISLQVTSGFASSATCPLSNDSSCYATIGPANATPCAPDPEQKNQQTGEHPAPVETDQFARDVADNLLFHLIVVWQLQHTDAVGVESVFMQHFAEELRAGL
jgi:sulfatase modifying factor 1